MHAKQSNKAVFISHLNVKLNMCLHLKKIVIHIGYHGNLM